ncbi:kinase-like domain-containing protein [Phyllosticta capitalensis]
MQSCTAKDLRALSGRQVLRKGMRLVGESGIVYLLRRNLTDFDRNIWSAREERSKRLHWYVVKQPNEPYFNVEGSWARRLRQFEAEKKVNKIFEGSKFVRQQVDTIKPFNDDESPRMVLEYIGKSVWLASQSEQGYTRREIKSIMKTTLMALQEVEQKGFVHYDLKMEDMLLSKEKLDPSKPDEFFVKISELNALSKPFQRESGSWTYRAPERHCDWMPVSFPAHIWSWGTILLQQLELRADFRRKGRIAAFTEGGRMYDEWPVLPDRDLSHMLLVQLAYDFKLNDCEYYAASSWPEGEPYEKVGWKDRLRAKGMRASDLEFLAWVLDPNPDTRPTSEQIVQSGFLEWTGEDVKEEEDEVQREAGN